MGFSILDGAMAFGNGVIEADKKNTKENLLIRAEELKAKRDAIIAMKKSKYEYDLNNYDKNKQKYDGLTAVSTKLNTGGFNFKDGENKGKVDTFQLGLEFLEAKHGIDWVAKKKAQLAVGTEGDPTAWNAYVRNVGNNPDLKSSISNIDFKSRNTMESNYLNSLEAIETKYSKALKDAKNDSSLVNAILGKKKEEIANLSLDAADDKSTIKTIDSATVKTDNTDSAVEAITSESVDTTDKKELEFADSKDSIFIPTSYRTNFEKKIDEARKIDYSSKEYNNLFSGTVLTLIPNSDSENFFEKNDKDGSLTAKPVIINADKTVQSLINGSLEDANVDDTFAITGNNKSAINFSANKLYKDAENHIQEYGTWMAKNGEIFSGKSLTNIFREKSTALVVPANSIINITNNKLKGFDIIINKDLRKDVGKVYRNFIVTKAEERRQIEGGTLEDNINALQRQLQNDNNGSEQLTKDARTYIALSLRDVTNADGELVYPSLTAKKEKDSTGQADNVSTGKSTMEIKQEELSSGADKEDFGNVRKITIKDKITGEDTIVPLTTKNMNWLRKNYPEVNLAVDQDTMTGDSKIAETIANETVKEKIKPADIGIKNQPVFETLESIKAILPNKMTGQEIMDKYEIGFKINKFTKYSPSK